MMRSGHANPNGNPNANANANANAHGSQAQSQSQSQSQSPVIPAAGTGARYHHSQTPVQGQGQGQGQQNSNPYAAAVQHVHRIHEATARQLNPYLLHQYQHQHQHQHQHHQYLAAPAASASPVPVLDGRAPASGSANPDPRLAGYAPPAPPLTYAPPTPPSASAASPAAAAAAGPGQQQQQYHPHQPQQPQFAPSPLGYTYASPFGGPTSTYGGGPQPPPPPPDPADYINVNSPEYHFALAGYAATNSANAATAYSHSLALNQHNQHTQHQQQHHQQHPYEQAMYNAAATHSPYWPHLVPPPNLANIQFYGQPQHQHQQHQQQASATQNANPHVLNPYTSAYQHQHYTPPTSQPQPPPHHQHHFTHQQTHHGVHPYVSAGAANSNSAGTASNPVGAVGTGRSPGPRRPTGAPPPIAIHSPSVAAATHADPAVTQPPQTPYYAPLTGYPGSPQLSPAGSPRVTQHNIMSPILGPGANSGATPLIGNPGGGGAGGATAATPATPAAGGKQPGGNGAAAKLQQVPPGTVIGGTRPQWSHEQQNTHAGLSPTSGATSPMRDSGIAGVNPHFRLGGHPPPDSALLSSSLGGSAIVDDTSSAASGASGAGLVCMYPRFQIGPRIGSGSFGCVYKGWHLKRNVPGVQLDESLGPVAIKVEPVTDDKGQPRTPVNGLLPAETAVLVAMSGKTGFPTVFWYGEFGVPQPVTETASGGSGSLMSGISEENPQAPPPLRMYRALVMDVLGPSLQDLFDKCGKKLSVKTVCMIADQMLCRLQELHYAGFLHRDLKPENVLMGLGPRKHILYLIDFGLACQRPLPSDPTPKRAEKCIGTLRYMCRSSHRGKPQTPRDDLEALGFLLVFFAKGSLPWQRKNLPAGAGKQHVPQDPNEQKRAVLKSKDEQVPHVLCAGLPPAFAEYMAQVRGMGFLDFPDYNKLRGLFSECVKSMGASMDWQFDWSEPVGAPGAESPMLGGGAAGKVVLPPPADSPMLFAGPAPGAALHQPPQYYAHQHHVPQALPIGYTHYQHQQQSHNLYDVRHAAAGADGGWQGAGAFFNGGVLVSDPMAAGAPAVPGLGYAPAAATTARQQHQQQVREAARMGTPPTVMYHTPTG